MGSRSQEYSVDDIRVTLVNGFQESWPGDFLNGRRYGEFICSPDARAIIIGNTSLLHKALLPFLEKLGVSRSGGVYGGHVTWLGGTVPVATFGAKSLDQKDGADRPNDRAEQAAVLQRVTDIVLALRERAHAAVT